MTTTSRGRIAIIGAGPAGMAAALAAHRLGFDTKIYERYPEVRPAGNILNLWPPPQKVLGLLGVDIHDLGAPADSVFVRNDGKLRARIQLPQAVKDEYGGGFIGSLREQPIRHQKLHLVAGYLFCEATDPVTVVAHNRTTQGSYSAIRHEGQSGYEWWVLEAFDPSVPFTEDLRAFATRRAQGFAEPLPSLIQQTPSEHLFRWEISDRKPLKQWSKGRVTLLGDAAHPTSPYAAYGAGMSIEDGYFLAAELEQLDLGDTARVRMGLQAFEDRRKKHTAQVSQMAWMNGLMFHRAPSWLAPVRDLIFDHTPLLQKVIGEATPGQILSQLDEIDKVEATRRAREPQSPRVAPA